jgi:hypothetical protein
MDFRTEQSKFGMIEAEDERVIFPINPHISVKNSHVLKFRNDYILQPEMPVIRPQLQ